MHHVDDVRNISSIARFFTPRRPVADFDELFRAHHPRLVDALTAASGNRENAADAVQEAFVKAHLRWDTVGRYEDPIGWVRRVAINKLRDGHRSDRRRQNLTDRLAGEPAESDPGNLPDQAVAALAELPKQQRLCMALFYIDELKIAEIAETLDIAEGSVKSHLHDARTRLRSQMSPSAETTVADSEARS